MCCSIDGEVRGYLPSSISDTVQEASQPVERAQLEQLNQKKNV